MTCQEFWNTMPELQEAQPPEGAGHLQECAACASRLARHDSLAAGLRRAAAGWGAGGAPPRVETRLRSAFRGYSGIGLARRRRRWIPVVTWAASAAAVATLAAFLVRDRGPEVPPRRTPSTMELAVLDAGENAVSDDEGFIPLPNTAHLARSEQVDLVRVEVPRSAMMALGIAVSAETAEERIQAEVKIGSDGLPRAVRFLNE